MFPSHIVVFLPLSLFIPLSLKINTFEKQRDNDASKRLSKHEKYEATTGITQPAVL